MTIEKNNTITTRERCSACNQWVEKQRLLESCDVSVSFTVEKVGNIYEIVAKRLWLLDNSHKELVDSLKDAGMFDDMYISEYSSNTIKEAISKIRKLATTIGKIDTFYRLESKDKNFEIHSRINSVDIYSKTESLVDMYELDDKPITSNERLSIEINNRLDSSTTSRFLKMKRNR